MTKFDIITLNSEGRIADVASQLTEEQVQALVSEQGGEVVGIPHGGYVRGATHDDNMMIIPTDKRAAFMARVADQG